jgi:hypothetical protein
MMLGLFAMFCGWCYNDLMSLPVEIDTCYTIKNGEAEPKED